MERRDFLKYMGVATLAGGAATSGMAGYLNGSDPMTRTGWESQSRDPNALFDRTPFEVDVPTYTQVGTPVRPGMFYVSGSRRQNLAQAFNIPEGMNFEQYLNSGVIDTSNFNNVPFDVVLDEDLRNFYEDVYARTGFNFLAYDLQNVVEINPFIRQMDSETEFDTFISRAFLDTFDTHISDHAQRVRSRGTDPIAENSDFILADGSHINDNTRFEPKSPAEMSALIKKIGHKYGASIVRIARLQPQWCYEHHIGGRGYTRGEPINIPDHWVYGIVLVSPMEWDTFGANPTWGATSCGDAHTSVAAARMAEFVKRLGYPAREDSPNAGYEWILPPIMVDSGVGEQGRMSVVVAPDLGANLRPSMVVTNIPLEPDRPIDTGIRRFCEHCMICAEQCPSGSISFNPTSSGEIYGRGYDGWYINHASCHNQRRKTPGGDGCRICLAVCPFSQKSNWLHVIAREVAVRDRSGAVAAGLTWMEKAFYGEHAPEDFHYELGSRRFGSVGTQPWWLNSERFFHES